VFSARQTVSFQPVLRGVETDIPGSVSQSPCGFCSTECNVKNLGSTAKRGKELFSGHTTVESQCVGDGEMESCGRVVLLLRLSVKS